MKARREDSFRGTAFSVLLHAAILAALLFSWASVKTPDSAGGDAGIEASMVKFGDLPSDLQNAIRGTPQTSNSDPLPTPVEAAAAEVPPEPLPESLPQPAPDPRPAPAETEVNPAAVTTRLPTPVPAETQAVKPLETKTASPPRMKPLVQPIQQKPAAAVSTRKSAAPSASQPTGAAKARADALARMRAEQLKDIQGGGSAATIGNPKGVSAAGGQSSVGKGAASGSTSGDQKRWLDAVAKAIEREWLRPDGIPKDQACPIRIRIIPGGEVISAAVQSSCPYSAAAKQSVHDAVMKASPLPFKGFENDYARDFTVNFYPSR